MPAKYTNACSQNATSFEQRKHQAVTTLAVDCVPTATSRCRSRKIAGKPGANAKLSVSLVFKASGMIRTAC